MHVKTVCVCRCAQCVPEGWDPRAVSLFKVREKRFPRKTEGSTGRDSIIVIR